MLMNPLVFAPASVLATLPFVMVIVWGAMLVLAGVLMLSGAILGNLYVLRAGLALLSGAAFVMGVGIVAFAGIARLFVVGTYFLSSWATGARYVSLGRLLKARREHWKDLIQRRR